MLLAMMMLAQVAPPAEQAPGDRPAAATVMVEPVGMMLAGFDRDGDGRTTTAEIDTGLAGGFAAIAGDAPDIGYIDFADWAERWLGNRAALPGPFEVDRDGNGRITLAELRTRMAGIVGRLDRDADGVLVRAELLTLRGAGMGSGQGRPRRR